MTYDTEKARLGRETFVQFELDLDFCSNLYGGGLLSPLNGTCTANLSAGSECRNVRFGCQDTDNFTKTTKTYTFCTPHPNLPVGVDMIPCIKGEPKFTPTEIKPDGGMSLRSSVQITVKDFPHHDRGIDPYFSTRSYDAISQGTFFGKLLANNPYYIGRFARVKDGYVAEDGTIQTQTRLYVIDKITGPTYSGDDILYTIICSDILALSKDTRIQIPPPTDGTLDAALTVGETTGFDLSGSSTVADYPTGGGIVVIGDEWITYGSRSSFTLSALTRGEKGTTAVEAKAGDGVQIVKNFTGTPVAIINEILNTYVGINASYIPYSGGSPQDEWDEEESNWFNGVSIDAYIGTPTGAFKLLAEICFVFQIDVWWNEVEALIKLKANTPPLGNTPVTDLSEDNNFIEGKTRIAEDPERRISRVILHYDKIDFSESDKISNYARHHFETDTEVEGVNLYDETKVKEIISRWLTSSNDSVAIQSAQRIIARFGETPKNLKFTLDAKDGSLKTGDLCDVTTSRLQDTDGSDKVTRFQVVKHKESKQGHQIEYDALLSSYTYNTRYAFIADNALDATSPMTVYNNANAAEKLANAFIGPNTGVFPDDGTLYLII